MKIKKIRFIFENCETVVFDGKYIGNFYLGEIKTDIRRVAVNAIRKIDYCGVFFIEIHKDGNKIYHPFEIESDTEFPFDRIKSSNDITDIEIEYEEDGIIEELSYLPIWSGDNEYTNPDQESIVGNNGNLYVKIGKHSLYHYFGVDMGNEKWPWMND